MEASSQSAQNHRLISDEEDLVPQLHCWYEIINKDQISETPSAVSLLMRRDLSIHVWDLKTKFTCLGAMTGWRGRMTSTATTSTTTGGERSKQTTCRPPRETDTCLSSTRGPSSSLEAMTGSTESMISLSTTLTITLGKKCLRVTITRLLPLLDILTRLSCMKTLCMCLEGMMAIIRMIFIDLTSLRIHGLL